MSVFKASDFDGAWTKSDWAGKHGPEHHRRHALDKEILAPLLNTFTDKDSLPEADYKLLRALINDGSINLHPHLSKAQNVGCTADHAAKTGAPQTRSVSDSSGVAKVKSAIGTGEDVELTSQEASHLARGMDTLFRARGSAAYGAIDGLLEDLAGAAMASFRHVYAVGCKRHPDGRAQSLAESVEERVYDEWGLAALGAVKDRADDVQERIEAAREGGTAGGGGGDRKAKAADPGTTPGPTLSILDSLLADMPLILGVLHGVTDPGGGGGGAKSGGGWGSGGGSGGGGYSAGNDSDRTDFERGGVVGYTATGLAMYEGPQGGTYHVSSGGYRQYH